MAGRIFRNAYCHPWSRLRILRRDLIQVGELCPIRLLSRQYTSAAGRFRERVDPRCCGAGSDHEFGAHDVVRHFVLSARTALDEEYAQAQMDYAQVHDSDHLGAGIQLYREQGETAARHRKAAEERAGRLSAAIKKLETPDR